MWRFVDVIVVPYDSGRRGYRMGDGPTGLVDGGIEKALRDTGVDVSVRWVESDDGEPLATAVAHAERVAGMVGHARAQGRFPLVLAGNCITTLGGFAGARGAGTGLIWLDAHGDLNTPETSPSGFLDGMGLAAILGWCHREAFAAVGGESDERLLEEQNLLLVGARDFDPAEERAIGSGMVALMSPAEASDQATRAARIGDFCAPLDDVYVHLDLDVLDPDERGPANHFRTPGGLRLDDVLALIRDVASQRPIVGLTVSAYDPAVDSKGRVGEAALLLVQEVAHLG